VQPRVISAAYICLERLTLDLPSSPSLIHIGQLKFLMYSSAHSVLDTYGVAR
jgi:hypothetical protein